MRPPLVAIPTTSRSSISFIRSWALEVGGVIHIHIRDDLVDPVKTYALTEKMRLIGRMRGRGWYARMSDLFLMDRLNLEDWDANKR